jgi:hypothetical protein
MMVDAFVNSGWIIKIIDFRNQEVRKYKNKIGLVVFDSKIIYLDVRKGTPQILLHELCHFSFRDFFVAAAQDLSWKEIKKVAGRSREDKEFNWDELRTREFEKLFFPCLNRRQVKILQEFIDEAQERYKKDIDEPLILGEDL